MIEQKENTLVQLIKALAMTPNADENIQLLLNMSAQPASAQNIIREDGIGEHTEIQTNGKYRRIVIRFSEQEMKKMATRYKKVYKKDGKTIYARERQSGKNTTAWEIRFTKNGVRYSVSGLTLEIAKRRFLERYFAETEEMSVAGTLSITTATQESKIPKNFHSFAMYYFENYRVKKVGTQTYKTDLGRYKRYLEPYFKETPLVKITLTQCQALVDNITNQGKGKTADEVVSLMNGIFGYAKNNHLIPHSPTDAILHTIHERTNGVALTKEEEQKLLLAVKDRNYGICFAIALYTGIRPNEYKSVEVTPDRMFIIAKNSKQKIKRNEIVYKKIPVSPMLRPYIDANPEPQMLTAKYLRKIMNNILPDHILYDLRTTFYNRCKECGVEEPAYKEFMGHTLKNVDAAYTDLSDEYLLKEGQKLVY